MALFAALRLGGRDFPAKPQRRKGKRSKSSRGLNMEFIVNKETKTVSITKEFDAVRNLVWDAYTGPSCSTNGGRQNPGLREQR